jgi:rhodanese-related sulfurtransferase
VQFIVDNWILIFLALVSGTLLLWPVLARGRQGQGVSATEAVRLINRERAVVIDVGEPAEFAAGHVAGARSVPLAALEAAKVGAKEGAKGLPTNKALPVIVVCPTGARAARAAAVLRSRGYDNARSLAGGLRAWREANLPIEKSA